MMEPGQFEDSLAMAELAAEGITHILDAAP